MIESFTDDRKILHLPPKTLRKFDATAASKVILFDKWEVSLIDDSAGFRPTNIFSSAPCFYGASFTIQIEFNLTRL